MREGEVPTEPKRPKVGVRRRHEMDPTVIDAPILSVASIALAGRFTIETVGAQIQCHRVHCEKGEFNTVLCDTNV